MGNLLKLGMYIMLFVFVMKSAAIGFYTGDNSSSAIALGTILVLVFKSFIIGLIKSMFKIVF